MIWTDVVGALMGLLFGAICISTFRINRDTARLQKESAQLRIEYDAAQAKLREALGKR